MIFKLGLEERERESQAESVGAEMNGSGRGESMCKGPELEKNLTPLKTLEEQDV